MALTGTALSALKPNEKPYIVSDDRGLYVEVLRRTASTLPHEKGWPSNVVEKALNRTIGCVRGVYNRTEYAEQRQEMLQFSFLRSPRR